MTQTSVLKENYFIQPQNKHYEFFKPLAGGNITNYSAIGNVRADIPFAVRYHSNVDEAEKIVLNILQGSDKVLQDPGPSV